MKFLFLAGSIFISCISYSQSITPDGPSYGFIVWDKSFYEGSAFVIKNKRLVVTCAHCISKDHTMYYASGGLKTPDIIMHKLKIIKFLPKYDLALLESDEDLCNRPFEVENKFNITNQQHMFYIGYSTKKSDDSHKVMQANNLQVSSYGKTFESGAPVDFIEFVGVGVPGYSGGPVINDSGKIVALMREAWLKKSIRGGDSLLVNRAYSIIPLLK